MRKEEIKREIFAMFKELRGARKSRWGRVLPVGEEISDRWEKARFLRFGEGTSIYDSSLVIGDVRVGKNTWIGPFTILDGSGELQIGDYCSIAAGVQIYSHETISWALSGGRMEYSRDKTIIGNCCYIGPNAVVSKGVKIGNHCLIGANSVVNEDVKDYTIGAGSPYKVIGRVNVDAKGVVKLLFRKSAGK